MCNELDKHWRDECGVFGIYLRDSSAPNEAARDTYFGLYALQHRGQESAGIAVASGGRIVLHKAMGLVSEVFSPEVLEGLTGTLAVGHVRYSSTGPATRLMPSPWFSVSERDDCPAQRQSG